MQVKGIDISSHNGIIDWDKVKAAGIEFAMLRAGFGSEHPNQIDEQFERNYTECKRVGIPVGAYHYSYAFSPSQAKQELKFFLKLLKGKQFEYPVCYDVEDCDYVHPELNITQDQLPKDILTDIVISFCDGLEKAGYYAALYSNPNWLNNKLEREKLARFDLWLAEWSKTRNYPYPCGIWQYTSKGRVNGIKGYTDRNIAYKDYPSIITSKGLNGYSKSDAAQPSKYTVTATKQGLDSTSAKALATKLHSLGMTVISKKEDK